MNKKVHIRGALFWAAAILFATFLSKGKPGAFWIDTAVFVVAVIWVIRFPETRARKCRVRFGA
ncbi:MAG: hypothetical protein JSS69_12685 [Acidobacteria bacterium]|nr:hypothetical protein [Acidobacteriota bacterium]MBS1866762.1 hypothetical protein [Acidobacteriota bacterium]